MYINKTFSLVLSILIINSSIIFSQSHAPKDYHLTHKMSAAEKELMKTYPKNFTETAPPTGEVRNIAEWEPMESVLIAYDYGFGIPYSLIAEMSEDCNVTTIVSGQSEENTVRNYYSSNGVNLSNCNFVYQDPDSHWTRDYSPWYIAIDDSEVAIVNFPYNRPRPNDNDVPILMADSLNIDLYGMNVIQTGGNYMCDGYGIAASTDLVWEEEESQTPEQINTKMLNYLGIETYHVTADPLDDYIKHIDCWGKFLDVDKILITQVPATDYRYNDYEALATYFSEQNCSWGYPYEVIRVQAATYNDYDVNPYSNSLILNDKVFVPQTGSSLDDDAIATYESAMPGYEIFGVSAGSQSWYNTDALHCRTHGVADREMLYIKHYPLHGDITSKSNFTIDAEVTSYGGSQISANFPILFYKQNSGDWEEVLMMNTINNNFTANIPRLGGDNNVEYYIYAENENNKSETHPLIGSTDPHTFSYSGGENILTAPNSNICFGSNTGNIALTEYTETITDWEKRLDGKTWQYIGHTQDTYSETPAEVGFWEYRVEFNSGSSYSTIASVTVNETTVGGIVTGGAPICEGFSTGTLSLNGQNGDIIKWEKQLNGETWLDISNTNTIYNEIPTEDGTWNYRAVVKNGECSEDKSVSTEVIVYPSAVGGTASATESDICTEETATVTLTSYDGDIQWQESSNEIDWFDLTGANYETYTSELLTNNVFYRANVTLGSCADSQSNNVAVNVFSNPEALYTFNANNQVVTFENTSKDAISYSWDFGDENSSIEENPTHTYSGSGTYTVSLTASNNICIDDDYSEEITVSFLGISHIESDIKIIPNPNNGLFTIQTPFITGLIQIFNITGKRLYSATLNSQKETIDISEFTSGIYLVKIENNNEKQYKKLIIK